MSIGVIASVMMGIMGFIEIWKPYGSGNFSEVIIHMWLCGACICAACGK